jgi:High-affinity nickel-transport protein
VFGLDDQIAGLGDGSAFAIVAAVAILLGLRHATDPDHLTAVTTLVAGGDRDTKGAGRLGLAWGLGHATTLFAFGVPIVLFRAYLPDGLQIAAEAAVGVVIAVLAIRLLVRWRRGTLLGDHAHPARARTRLQAYGIGLVHGAGGSAGVGVLLLAAIPGHAEALAALALFALFTAVSMAAASTTFGFVLTRDAVAARWTAVAPALGVLSLAFGVWYSLGAVEAVPYLF